MAQPVVGCNADATALKEAGNVAFSSGKHLQSYELFSEAILKDPSSALLRSNRAGALASLGRHEEAYQDAEICCKLQRDWWKGYTRRGHALFHLNRYQESEQSFVEALRLNPGEQSVMEALAKTRGSIGGQMMGGQMMGGQMMGGQVIGQMMGGQMMGGQMMGGQVMGGQMMGGQMMGGQMMGGQQAPFYPVQQAVAYPGQQAPVYYLGQQAPGGQLGGAVGSTYAPQPHAFAQLGAAMGGTGGFAMPPQPAGASSAPGRPQGDFQKLSVDELRAQLQRGAAQLTDEALDTELQLAQIKVPKGATRADKEKLYTQSAFDGKDSKKTAKAKAQKKSEGDKLLELRKKWVDEWNKWDDDRLVKRLAKLGTDGAGLSRAQLLDELLQVETERHSNRCSPQTIQKYSLGGVGASVAITFLVVVIIAIT